MRRRPFLPATHHVAISTKDLSQATDNHVGPWDDIDVKEVSDRLVDNDCEVESVRKLSNSSQIWSLKKWVPRNLTEEGCEYLSLLTALFEVGTISIRPFTVKEAPCSEFLEYLKGVNIWKPGDVKDTTSQRSLRYGPEHNAFMLPNDIHDHAMGVGNRAHARREKEDVVLSRHLRIAQ